MLRGMTDITIKSWGGQVERSKGSNYHPTTRAADTAIVHELNWFTDEALTVVAIKKPGEPIRAVLKKLTS